MSSTKKGFYVSIKCGVWRLRSSGVPTSVRMEVIVVLMVVEGWQHHVPPTNLVVQPALPLLRLLHLLALPGESGGLREQDLGLNFVPVNRTLSRVNLQTYLV